VTIAGAASSLFRMAFWYYFLMLLPGAAPRI
jgi:hypothetical protein